MSILIRYDDHSLDEIACFIYHKVPDFQRAGIASPDTGRELTGRIDEGCMCHRVARPGNRRVADCVFRVMVGIDFTGSWAVISREAGH